MKLGFICLNLPGHLNPMTALGVNCRGATMRLSSFILRALTVCRVFLVTIGIPLMKTGPK